jgi:DNA polymerase
MLAWLAGQDDLLAQFAHGDDIYSNFASTVYNRPINKTDDPTERFVGKTAILGLGYGMGAKKFQGTLASGAAGPSLEFTDAEAAAVVTKYRQSYSKIPLLWRRLENFLMMSLQRNQPPLPFRVLSFENGNIQLPNKMWLKYQDLTLQDGQLIYTGRNGKEKTYGGRLAENVVQALSRIVITDAMLRLEQQLPEAALALTVHDEIVLVASDKAPDGTMSQVIDTLCTPPSWASDLPLDAEGGYAKNYSK